MRLIDKDRLLKGSNHYWLEMENFGDIEAIDVRFIEMAEEIKAIPIEWINNWLNTGRNAKYFIPMMEMIEEWENENEQKEVNKEWQQ